MDNIVLFVHLEDGNKIDSLYTFTIKQFKEYYYGLNDDEIPETALYSIYKKLEKYVATPEELAKHREETRRRFNYY